MMWIVPVELLQVVVIASRETIPALAPARVVSAVLLDLVVAGAVPHLHLHNQSEPDFKLKLHVLRPR